MPTHFVRSVKQDFPLAPFGCFFD